MQQRSTDAAGRARIIRSERLLFAPFCPLDTFVPHASRARATSAATSPRKQVLSLVVYLSQDSKVSNPLGPLDIFKFDKQVHERNNVFFTPRSFLCR